MTHSEIIRKLIGPVMPVGETREDEARLANIMAMSAVLLDLLDDLTEAVKSAGRHEMSMAKIGKYAADTLGIVRESTENE